MINHTAALLALRTKLLALSVATTGSTTLSATSTGYARSSGSFVTDGFRTGMEVTGTSFSNAANNTAKTITEVTALAITASGCTTEAAGTRTLTVNLPSDRRWTNVHLKPTTGKPYFEEQYLPGPMDRITLGATSVLEVLPQYLIRISAPSNVGIDGLFGYADALLTHFAPNTSITLTGSTLKVRGDVAPYAGQVTQTEPGFAAVLVTVPLRLRTANSI